MTGSVSECRTARMPNDCTDNHITLPSDGYPYADHAALRPHAAAFGGRHSARSALRPWPTVSAHVDTGHVPDPVCSVHRPGLDILARIIYYWPKRSGRSGRGPTVEKAPKAVHCQISKIVICNASLTTIYQLQSTNTQVL